MESHSNNADVTSANNQAVPASNEFSHHTLHDNYELLQPSFLSGLTDDNGDYEMVTHNNANVTIQLQDISAAALTSPDNATRTHTDNGVCHQLVDNTDGDEYLQVVDNNADTDDFGYLQVVNSNTDTDDFGYLQVVNSFVDNVNGALVQHANNSNNLLHQQSNNIVYTINENSPDGDSDTARPPPGRSTMAKDEYSELSPAATRLHCFRFVPFLCVCQCLNSALSVTVTVIQ